MAVQLASWPWVTGLGVQVTVPLTAAGVAMEWVLGVKVAETVRDAVTLVNWHAPVPVQSPDQLVKW